MAMLLAIISVVWISADDVIVNDEYIAFFENDIAADEFEEELMPLAVGGCWVDGYTYATTAAGLDEIGLQYTGSGKNISLVNTDYSIKQSQCGTDRCVFVSYKGEQTHWFKVSSW